MENGQLSLDKCSIGKLTVQLTTIKPFNLVDQRDMVQIRSEFLQEWNKLYGWSIVILSIETPYFFSPGDSCRHWVRYCDAMETWEHWAKKLVNEFQNKMGKYSEEISSAFFKTAEKESPFKKRQGNSRYLIKVAGSSFQSKHARFGNSMSLLTIQKFFICAPIFIKVPLLIILLGQNLI